LQCRAISIREIFIRECIIIQLVDFILLFSSFVSSSRDSTSRLLLSSFRMVGIELEPEWIFNVLQHMDSSGGDCVDDQGIKAEAHTCAFVVCWSYLFSFVVVGSEE
jgi:hypothetical protein